MNNIVATKKIRAFTINLSDWFYEGQMVDIKDKSVGILRNALIEYVDEINQAFTVIHNGHSYNLSMLTVEDVTSVNRRRIAV
ncbi:hypothetical protein [Butyrivibrio sp. AC2005]|uniref:hypothetical protein n=1 Tax=Butyrivibrio sp. AC2005 TaxID=1280672 RepID=UPI0003F56258|nr:hypothetical protein [Butyrivibrio sp. AC2005]